MPIILEDLTKNIRVRTRRCGKLEFERFKVTSEITQEYVFSTSDDRSALITYLKGSLISGDCDFSQLPEHSISQSKEGQIFDIDKKVRSYPVATYDIRACPPPLTHLSFRLLSGNPLKNYRGKLTGDPLLEGVSGSIALTLIYLRVEIRRDSLGVRPLL